MDKATYAAFVVINNKLNRILKLLGEEVMPELDALGDEITRLEGLVDAAVTKIQQLLDQGATNVDPAVVQALVDRLKAAGDRLAVATS